MQLMETPAAIDLGNHSSHPVIPNPPHFQAGEESAVCL
jgi:hypothetical protein